MKIVYMYIYPVNRQHKKISKQSAVKTYSGNTLFSIAIIQKKKILVQRLTNSHRIHTVN